MLLLSPHRPQDVSKSQWKVSFFCKPTESDPASWARDLGGRWGPGGLNGPALGLMLYCQHLESLTSQTKGPAFVFCPGPCKLRSQF